MRIFIAFCLGMFSLCALAAPVQVQGVRIWAAPDNTRVVFDLTAPAEHTLLHLDNPPRVVIDIPQARLSQPLAQPSAQDRFLAGLRGAEHGADKLRIVLDLKAPASAKSFLLTPNQRYGHRLVVDVLLPDSHVAVDATPAASSPVRPPAADKLTLRDVVIAIDAGHGGEDPGARGPGGTYEKIVVLEIARRLARLIEAEPGMRPVMIRDGDYFVPLRKRIEIARKQRADLLISIHADAFRDHRVRGSSVYVLSPRGASSEAARWLAEQENASDLIGGVSLEDKDDMLKAVLLDLSQTGTLEASIDVAERVLDALARAGKVHRQKVQSAGFLVLKSPDIPSILVETAFISNPGEEQKLRDPAHQERLAAAILDGLRGYFREHAPDGTLFATQRRHVIARGETLSTIARQYGVSPERLKASNGLTGDSIRVGQVLVIPSDSDS